MAIVKMDLATIVGLAVEREAVVEALMRLGAVQLAQTAGDELARSGKAENQAVDERTAAVSRDLARLEKAIGVACQISKEKKPTFTLHRKVSQAAFLDVAARETEILDRLSQLEHNLAYQDELRGESHALSNANLLLIPWQDMDIDLSLQETEHVRIFLGSLDSAAQLAQLEELLADEAPETVVWTLPCDLAAASEDSCRRVLIATWKPRAAIVSGHLRQLDFDTLPLQGEQGAPRQLVQANSEKLAAISERLALLEEENLQLAASVRDFETLHGLLGIRLDKIQTVARLGGTQSTFWLQAWIPSHLVSGVRQGLASRFVTAFESRPARPDEDYPILLKNHPLVKPFEVVAQMFSPPSRDEIDPTSWIAPFYFFFFGIMLSDVGYGLILTVLCALLIYKVKVEGNMRNMCRLFMFCGISSIAWGFMFGGLFGDMLAVLSNQKIVLPALWFNPMDDPTTLMIWSIIFGVIHLFTGMFIKIMILFRTGHWLDALLDIVPWYLIIVGAGLMITSIGGQAGSILAVAGAAVIVLFGGRDAKNPIMRLLKGLMALYGMTSYIGDILSYTRILALTMATSVIAMVVNLLGFLGGPTIPGTLVFIVVALFGHALNMALSTLSAYVHTSRLHYVEFFGKFYEGGGRAWEPLRLNMKYIEVSRDPGKALR
jgi:V/A-type H+-transporting ATPase subunit I